MSGLQKGVFMALVVAIIGLLTPATAEAKSVICFATAIDSSCYHSDASCEERLGGASAVAWYRELGVACVDYLVVGRPTGPVVLNRAKGRPATITVDGKTRRIASAGLEAFLDRKFREQRGWPGERRFDKARIERFAREVRDFVARDPGISDAGLLALSRELKAPIRDQK